MSDKIREAFDTWFSSDVGPDLSFLTGEQADHVYDLMVDEWKSALAQQPAPAVPEGWRPIETAPKNGVEIILRKGDRVTSGAWAEWSESYPEFHGTTGAWLGNVEYESGAAWASWDGGFAEGDEPEYWIPLPTSAAPAAPVAQEPVACCPYCAGSSGRCDTSFPHPPAAEQPDTVKVPRETAIALLDDGPRHKTWLAQDELRALLAGGDKP